MVNTRSKHHNLCNIVRKHFEQKCRGRFYNVIREEVEYGMQRTSYKNGRPIMGECDCFAVRYAQNKKYLVVVEVKSNNTKKGRRKAKIQLAKDSIHYKQLFKVNKVFAIYAHGYNNDKKGVIINYKLISQSELEKIIIK